MIMPEQFDRKQEGVLTDSYGSEAKTQGGHLYAMIPTTISGIAFTRARDFVGICCPLNLAINKLWIDAVPYGARRVYALSPGIYTIQIAMAWCVSPPYEVEVRPDQIVELEGSVR